MRYAVAGVRWDLDPSYYEDAAGIIEGGHFDSELRGFGLSPGEMRHFWRQGYSQPILADGSPNPEYPTNGEYYRRSLARILELEDVEPGLAASLRSTNGIRNFGRGNLGMFYTIARNRGVRAARSVGFAVASYCNSGSLSLAYPQWYDIALERHPDTAYDFVEVADVGEYELLQQLAEGHGGRSAIQVLGVHAHSDGQRLGLAGPSEMSAQEGRPTLGAEHLQEMLPLLGSITMPHTSVVLDACKTGMEGGLAEHLHESTGLTTIAPPCEAVSTRFWVEEDPATGVLVPSVVFMSEQVSSDNEERVVEVAARVLRSTVI